ncbi:precorrin-6A synthase (deacetylating) [Phaeobacter sp. J2-8]|uniref:precorrin-6A synthase (deacetylating) n=1 Tax=Phaeobacter sp. J2-8 TaxID=2931394 RepID=UPI001FD11E27|nr:precorrin-6A synthase (deacetylating) [Phaeobacter sp. J2-8]MCJ7874443.1 precorrin-6A synthase (deacetylating) [Phaeobacter sp. J2-8]
MIELDLIGIGTGNPDHVTAQAVQAMNAADLILIPLKGPEKTDLAGLRRDLLARHLDNAQTQVVEFDLPQRDVDNPSYRTGVSQWHDAIAASWEQQIRTVLGENPNGRVALLIWGDPMLYDSSLRIAERLGRRMPLEPRVIPGITSIQALCAAHAIPLNTVGGSVTILTGRQLRAQGWPPEAETVVVVLDSGGAFETLDPEGISIWWGGCVAMPQEKLVAGQLDAVGAQIIKTREDLRARHGWVMDIYLMRRAG